MNADYVSRFSTLPPRNENNDLNLTATPGLPAQFLKSMRTLFDILDDNGVGSVPLSEIERRWRDDAVPNLPGVLDCLRAVVPPSGMLSFDTFVLGLRSALVHARQTKARGKPLGGSNLTNGGCYNTNGYKEPNGFRTQLSNKPAYEGINGYSPTVNGSIWNEEQGSYSCSAQQKQRTEANRIAHGGDDPSIPRSFQQQQNISDLDYDRPESNFQLAQGTTNSDFIPTAKVLPAWNRNRPKITKMGYATKFSVQDFKGDVSDRENSDISKSSDKSSVEELKLTSARDRPSPTLRSEGLRNRNTGLASNVDPHYPAAKVNVLSPNHNSPDSSSPVTASQRQNSGFKNFGRFEESPSFEKGQDKFLYKSMKTCETEEKYIDIAKAAAVITSQYGSLRRPAMSAPIKNGSPVEFIARLPSHGERRRGKCSSRHHGRCDDARRRRYASAGESGDESHTRILPLPKRSSSCEQRRSANTNVKVLFEHGQSEKRFNRKSPSELPPPNPIGSFEGPDVENGKREELDSASHHLEKDKSDEPRQLSVPPPPGRSLNTRSAALYCSQESKTSTIEISYPHYATLGKRRSAAKKRKDPRRHTVTDGINYDMIKSAKFLEQEKDLLKRGIEALNRGLDSFQSRLATIQERQIVLHNTEVDKEEVVSRDKTILTESQLSVLSRKISEMESVVNAATNLQVEDEGLSPHHSEHLPVLLTSLRKQNHVLTTELSKQAERIEQLEKEKLSLVQQVFSAQPGVAGKNTSIFI